MLEGREADVVIKVLKDCVVYCEHANRKTVTVVDVIHALQRIGKPIYGMLHSRDGCSLLTLGQRIWSLDELSFAYYFRRWVVSTISFPCPFFFPSRGSTIRLFYGAARVYWSSLSLDIGVHFVGLFVWLDVGVALGQLNPTLLAILLTSTY